MGWLKLRRPRRPWLARRQFRRRTWLPPVVSGLAALAVAVGGWLASARAAESPEQDQRSSPPSAATASVPARAPLLTALGDSTAVGVGARSGSYVDRVLARLTKGGRPHALLNLSVSGATARDVLQRQVPRLGEADGGLVLLGVGANDLMRNLPPAAFARHFEALVAGIRGRTRAAVVVSNVPDVSLSRAVWPAVRPAVAARVDAYNDVIAAVARKHDLHVFDLCRLTRDQLPTHPEYLSSDGYHPSDLGYEAWAEGLWRVVRRAL